MQMQSNLDVEASRTTPVSCSLYLSAVFVRFFYQSGAVFVDLG